MTLQETFAELTKAWKREKQLVSSMSKIEGSKHYQAIITLGKDVIPLILDELEREPDYWFHALSQLTGKNPIPADIQGNLKKMTACWLEWRKKNSI